MSTTTASCAGTRPPGEWLVLRFGASLTGQTNGPAPPEATGLEVDKLDGAKVRRYLDTYLGRVRATPRHRRAAQRQHRVRAAELHRPAARALRRAARLRPAALAARARRLRRRRRRARPTASSGTTGARSPSCSRASTTATLEAEAHGAGSPTTPRRWRTTGRSSATTWRCAATRTCRWARCGCSTPARGGPAPTYLADLKGASSVAHVYGKAVHRRGVDDRVPPAVELHAPAAQARRRPRARPRRHPLLHPHLPAPADAGAAARHRPRRRILGQAFIRTEPWAELAGPWIDYLARCSWLLNQGAPAVDVAVFVGEEAPLTALFGEEPDRVGPAGLRLRLRGPRRPRGPVHRRRRRSSSPGTARYRLLLPRRVERPDDGARPASHRRTGRRGGDRGRPASAPARRPSPTTTREHARLCDRLWGAGRRRWTPSDLARRAADRGCRARRSSSRARTCCGSAGASAAGERRLPGQPARRNRSTATVTTSAGRAPRRLGPGRAAPGAAAATDGRYRLTLPALGSVFLVAGGPADRPPGAPAAEVPLATAPGELTLPGRARDRAPGGPPALDGARTGRRGFAGVGTYTHDDRAGAPPLDGRAAVLDLADVGDLARVRVNGVDCGVVWTAPFRVDVTGALRPGRNRSRSTSRTPG